MGINVNISGTYKNVSELFANVGGSWKRIVEVYNNIGGVWKKAYEALKSASRVGVTASTLQAARFLMTGTNVGDYALFAGGVDSSNESSLVDAYNSSLVRSTPSSLSYATRIPARAHVGNYALFGGYLGGNILNAYNTSLVKSTPASLVNASGTSAGTNVGNYALFAGLNGVDAYDLSLVRTTASALSVSRVPESASNANYALFAGGSVAGGTSYLVDAYNSSLVRSSPSSISSGGPCGVSKSTHALFLFIGQSAVDAYNTSLVKSTASAPSASGQPTGASIDDVAIVGGFGATTPAVNSYNKDLVRSLLSDFSQGQSSCAAAAVGKYILFAGGRATSSYTTTGVVQVYKVDY